jgi:hypothetical protein
MSYDYNALVSTIANHRRLAEAAQTRMNEMDTNMDTNMDAMNTDENNTIESDTKEQDHLEKALEAFEQLSSHCPMTPLLWMQYAATTARLIERAFLGCSSGSDTITEDDRAAAARSALETRLQTIQLGLQEFPGSALLQWYHVSLLKRQLPLMGISEDNTEVDNDTMTKMAVALTQALEQVGLGSHRNEGDWVASIYRLQARFYALTGGTAHKVRESFVRRAQTPMKDANDTIMEEFQTMCREYHQRELRASPEDVAKIENGRRREAKQFGWFSTWEDEVDVAMQREGILARDQIEIVPSGADGVDPEPNWDVVLQSGDQRYGMGLGGQETAIAFVRYALAFHKCKVPRKSDGDDDNYDDDTPDPERPLSGIELSKLALAVYERGVAECPTVESIWLSYVRCLVEMVQRGDPFASTLQSVVSRAVRNCPYSVALVQQKLNVALLLAERGAAVLDPDTLMETVREAIDTKFLPGPKLFLDLYMTAIMTVKRRILFLIAQACTPSASAANGKVLAYDDAESLPHNNSKKENTASASNLMDPESLQEVNDLCDDIVDMYDGVNTLLMKQHPKWTEGRSLLWKERAQTETLLLAPLRAIDEKIGSSSIPDTTDEALVYLEKAIRTHAPPHPDSHSVYIQHFMYTATPSTEMDVLLKLRRVRGLYQKAVNAVGKPKAKAAAASVPTEPPARDFETALSCLCHDWMLFEGAFGSERSQARASKVIEKKLHKANLSSVPSKAPAPQPSTDTKGAEANVSSDQVAKRKLEDLDDAEQPAKKQKTERQVDESNAIKKAIASKKALPKVHVGNLEYPAHPFTVRVSNLSLDAEEMDLVDAFRSKCGAIVHAKIIREKHLHQGMSISKGCGLVQFEERDAVEKALELDDVLGIKEKIINVERSHVPASSIVPPGMHRVNPMGEGKSSKRNQKRREQRSGVAEVDKSKTANLDQSLSSENKESKRSQKRREQKTGVAEVDKSNTANLDQSLSSEKKEESKEEKKAHVKAQPIEFNPLAFRPRSVGRSKVQRKVTLSLGDKKSEGNKG